MDWGCGVYWLWFCGLVVWGVLVVFLGLVEDGLDGGSGIGGV